MTGDVDFFSDNYDLDPTFCGSLNASLFDGEFPSKLYSHIKIKDDDDIEMWFNDAFSKHLKSGISSCTFESSTLPDDKFDEPFELISELFNSKPQAGVQPSEETDNQTDNISTEVANSVDETNISLKAAEDSTSPSDETGQNLFKRELRTRRKRVQAEIDHDYSKPLDGSRSTTTDSDDEYQVEQDDDNDDDDDEDEDFGVPCPAKRSRKTNSKATKDDKYWERRQRNNIAAKRSREAKRVREIQIAKKTAALEKENASLKKQVKKLKADIKRAEKMLRIMV